MTTAVELADKPPVEIAVAIAWWLVQAAWNVAAAQPLAALVIAVGLALTAKSAASAR